VVLLFILAALFLVQGFDAMAQEARARYELLNLIRKDKFDKVLPGAMRDNNVDPCDPEGGPRCFCTGFWDDYGLRNFY